MNSSTGVTPSGTVSFNEGNTMLGTGTLDGTGTATVTTATLSKGKHNIKAVHGATGAFSGSTSAVVTQVVQ
ncbi:MAG TPA: Ig-like domain repeat protein [Pyrinomonadaceae bacterium]|nr:Ig-like domain repeat protein [Pyrinomonadaceae bacterium]